MLLRRDERGHLAIGQPAHAWISGQLARAWGNDRFPAPAPHEEVCLSAEQHDIGMAAWDLDPARNPGTGLPYSFTEMPLAVHMELWRAGPRRLVRQSRYAALLVSMHGTRLYERRDLSPLSAADAQQVRHFLEDQRRFRRRLLSSLRADPATRASADHDLVARNSQLLWTWDSLSLAICLDWAPFTLHDVPSAGGPADIRLSAGARPHELRLDPWPLTPATLVVRCEGQRLENRVDTDDALARALVVAPWEALAFTLVPPQGQ